MLCGPPTVAGSCWYVWHAGRQWMLRGREPGASTAYSSLAGLGALALAYQAQVVAFVTPLSAGWKPSSSDLGEPLKISTWRQFYRSSGPPVLGRVAALVSSCYVAGAAAAWWATPAERRGGPKPKQAR